MYLPTYLLRTRLLIIIGKRYIYRNGRSRRLVITAVLVCVESPLLPISTRLVNKKRKKKIKKLKKKNVTFYIRLYQCTAAYSGTFSIRGTQ